MKPTRILALLLAIALAWWWQSPRAPSPAADRPVAGQVLPSFLPAEARDTLALIARGGPYPHRQDGTVFQNREGRLPQRPRGWYREYTVRTPGERTRGARRIVTGGDPPSEFWYTADHYGSFRRFEVGP
jgi:guanyl-specific ribonuclease Sa